MGGFYFQITKKVVWPYYAGFSQVQAVKYFKHPLHYSERLNDVKHIKGPLDVNITLNFHDIEKIVNI